MQKRSALLVWLSMVALAGCPAPAVSDAGADGSPSDTVSDIATPDVTTMDVTTTDGAVTDVPTFTDAIQVDGSVEAACTALVTQATGCGLDACHIGELQTECPMIVSRLLPQYINSFLTCIGQAACSDAGSTAANQCLASLTMAATATSAQAAAAHAICMGCPSLVSSLGGTVDSCATGYFQPPDGGQNPGGEALLLLNDAAAGIAATTCGPAADAGAFCALEAVLCPVLALGFRQSMCGDGG
jgi:hypothetical protein